tara:strand:+ start:176646 stop:177941 length:1296 start_codon:yes stop_codon:yes gene_type:complete
MSRQVADFLAEHARLTRRFLLQAGIGSGVTIASPSFANEDADKTNTPQTSSAYSDATLQSAVAELESWLTHPDDFRDVSRGKPKPHSLPDDKKKEVGMTRKTWSLDVISDPENPATIANPLAKETGNAFTFDDLMSLAKDHSVRFAKVMTCLNIGCPLGMGIWEGVPLRHVIWKTKPTENLRRVFYYGYHNDDPKQMFRSSLPISRILEDPFDLPPVILCYKLNGQWLSSERGGPVRVVVPEAYGFKSIKWLSHVILSNLFYANDTYGEKNNDVDSPLKTFAATLTLPGEVKAGEPFPVTGYAQVGISGLTKVQYSIQPRDAQAADDDRTFSADPWTDATILEPPKSWGGGIKGDQIPAETLGFDERTGQPKSWPMRLAKAHWAALLDGRSKGEYIFRCRTIDANDHAQPMPRPFRKLGHSDIETKLIRVI